MPTQIIAFATTQVSAEKTADEIEEMLRKHEATKTGKEYESGRIKSLYFQMDTPNGVYPFMLPVNVEAVYQLLLNQRRQTPKYRWGIPQKVHCNQ